MKFVLDWPTKMSKLNTQLKNKNGSVPWWLAVSCTNQVMKRPMLDCLWGHQPQVALTAQTFGSFTHRDIKQQFLLKDALPGPAAAFTACSSMRCRSGDWLPFLCVEKLFFVHLHLQTPHWTSCWERSHLTEGTGLTWPLKSFLVNELTCRDQTPNFNVVCVSPRCVMSLPLV